MRAKPLAMSIVGGLVIILLISWAAGLFRGTGAKPAEGPTGDNSKVGTGPHVEVEKPSKSKIIDQSTAEADLMRWLPQIVNSELARDAQVQTAFMRKLDKLSPAEVAELARKWPQLRVALSLKLAKEADPEKVASIALQLKDDSQARSTILFTLGEKFEKLSPEQLDAAMALLDGDSQKSLAGGLAARISNIPEETEKLAKIDLYLQNAKNAELSNRLVAERIKMMPMADSIKWLLDTPPSLASAGDRQVLSKLKAEEFDAAAEFVNTLIGRGEKDRAKSAIEQLVDTTSKADPVEAFEWVQSLPTDVRNNQMLTTSYAALCRNNPEEAARILSSTSDAKLKSLFQRIAKSNQAESPKK